jgi:hypothetical protein
MIILNPYKKASKGARALKLELMKLGHTCFIGSKQPKSKKTLLVSWGNSEFDFDPGFHKVVNRPQYLKTLTNKLHFFRKVGHEEYVPTWTTDAFEAAKWGCKLLVRHRLEASGGIGITVIDEEQIKSGVAIPAAPLYVKYENKTHEFRVHMARPFRGGAFTPLLVQRKIFQKKHPEDQPKDWNIRNHANGFVYVRESGYPCPEKVLSVAKELMEKHFSDLHFAALDIIFHEKRNTAFVLEGNTAPGLEGNTVSVYADYISALSKEAA